MCNNKTTQKEDNQSRKGTNTERGSQDIQAFSDLHILRLHKQNLYLSIVFL